MSKLLTTLIAAVFAVTTTSAFAQAPAPKGDAPKAAEADKPKAEKKATASKGEAKATASKGDAKAKKSKSTGKSKGKSKGEPKADAKPAEKK